MIVHGLHQFAGAVVAGRRWFNLHRRGFPAVRIAVTGLRILNVPEALVLSLRTPAGVDFEVSGPLDRVSVVRVHRLWHVGMAHPDGWVLQEVKR